MPQQLAGSNAVAYYLGSIFTDAGKSGLICFQWIASCNEWEQHKRWQDKIQVHSLIFTETISMAIYNAGKFQNNFIWETM